MRCCVVLTVEEQETFALALAKEMKAMKESYEAQLEELTHELRTAQKLRMESTQRLRTELDDERKRSQHIVRSSLMAASACIADLRLGCNANAVSVCLHPHGSLVSQKSSHQTSRRLITTVHIDPRRSHS